MCACVRRGESLAVFAEVMMDEQVNGQEALVQVRAVRPRIADLRRNLPPPPSHERAHRPRRALASHIVWGVAEGWW